jgi:dihydrofolate reductase
MTHVITSLSTSVDGFITGPDPTPEQPLGVGGMQLFDWFSDGDTPSRLYESFRMSKESAEVFDAGVERVGAVVAGRNTYDVSGAWGGQGPLPGAPLFVITHAVPDDVPAGDPPYTFVTDGIESAIEQARVAASAAGKDVALMGADTVQQALRAGLLDEFTIEQIPVLLGRGVSFFGELPDKVQLERTAVVAAPGVTHLTYRVVR